MQIIMKRETAIFLSGLFAIDGCYLFVMATRRSLTLLVCVVSRGLADDGCLNNFREATTSECPGEDEYVPGCDSDGLVVGDLCESDGECGLSTSLDNCEADGADGDFYVVGHEVEAVAVLERVLQRQDEGVP